MDQIKEIGYVPLEQDRAKEELQHVTEAKNRSSTNSLL